MKVMIDMDDVLVEDALIPLMSDFIGKDLSIDDAESYYLQDLLGDKKDAFFEYFKDINMYDGAELMPDAYEVIEGLINKYDIYICTSYIWPEMVKDSGNMLKYKYDYLLDHLPFISPNKYIFASDKSLIKCEVKIDDKLENLDGAKVKLLYTAYHNKNIRDEELKRCGVIRVNSWLDIKRVLEGL